MLYLCTRNQEGNTTESKVLGALVQLVRIRACHARGQGFESPTHRTKEDNRKVVFFFCVCILARAMLIASARFKYPHLYSTFESPMYCVDFINSSPLLIIRHFDCHIEHWDNVEHRFVVADGGIWRI